MIVEGSALALLVTALAVVQLLRTRRAKKSLEDRLVDLYSMSVQAMSDMLSHQEQILDRLRRSPYLPGAGQDLALAERLGQIERDLAHGRDQFANAVLCGEALQIDWPALMRAKADCESIWKALVEALGPAEEKRRVRFAAALERIRELEAQVDSLACQTPEKGLARPAADSPEARQALERIEGQWEDRLAQAQQQDESVRQSVQAVAAEFQNLEMVNQRLLALSAKLRDCQQAMARRIAELEAQAEMTPRLKSELQSFRGENERLLEELQRLAQANKTIEEQMAALRQTVGALEAQQAPRSEALKSQIAEDRQVLLLLREQNQRLIFELEEAREEAELARRQAAGQSQDDLWEQSKPLEYENEQLVAQHVRAQRSLKESQMEVQELREEIRRLRASSLAPAETKT